MTNGRDRLEEWTDVLDDSKPVTLLRRLGRSQLPGLTLQLPGIMRCKRAWPAVLCRPLASPLVLGCLRCCTACPRAFHKPAAVLSEPLSLMTKAWLKLDAPCNSGSNLHMCCVHRYMRATLPTTHSCPPPYLTISLLLTTVCGVLQMHLDRFS